MAERHPHRFVHEHDVDSSEHHDCGGHD
jgi:hypothetical protein